jgi:hypothetical protein
MTLAIDQPTANKIAISAIFKKAVEIFSSCHLIVKMTNAKIKWMKNISEIIIVKNY